MLKTQTNRQTTSKTYHGIWNKFNKFLIRLDHLPKDWEERIFLYCTHLVCEGKQSSTVKTYVSAIKASLKLIDYHVDHTKLLVTSLTRACKLKNDVVTRRLPISLALLELVLFELEIIFEQQYYLELLYKAMFLLAYYGMMCVGEITLGNHVVKAKDIHSATNKKKLTLFLYSSKTHGKSSRPQQISITSSLERKPRGNRPARKTYCPYDVIKEYVDT